jgi:hypothetical protein
MDFVNTRANARASDPDDIVKSGSKVAAIMGSDREGKTICAAASSSADRGNTGEAG